MVLSDNVLAYWKLNNNGNSEVDNSSYSLTALGTATFNASGKIGYCAQFLGTTTGGFKTSTSATALKLETAGQEFTISFWVKPSSSGANHVFMAMRTSTGWRIIMGNSGRKPEFISGAFDFATNTALTFGTAYFLTFVMDSVNAIWYINGVADATTSRANLQTSDAPYFTIGSEQDSSLTTLGLIDEVSIWNRALSPTEVSQLNSLMNSGWTYPFTDPNTPTIRAPDGISQHDGRWLKTDYPSISSEPKNLIPEEQSLISENTRGIR